MHYKCPCCNITLVWDINNPNRPFCSERCKNRDFMGWANEEHRLPDNGTDDDLEHFD